MWLRGLKTKIALNIALLLLLATVSMDLVMLVMAKRDLIRSEISRADILLGYLKSSILDDAFKKKELIYLKPEKTITRMLNDSQIAGVLIMVSGNEEFYVGHGLNFGSDEMRRITEKAILAGKKTVQLRGSSWSVFWNQKVNLSIATPLMHNGVSVGGINVVLPLEGVYKNLRYTQQLLFIYGLINIAILTLVGAYQVSRVYLKPLSRLAKKADDYKEDDEFIFAVRKEDNELNRLSKALNSMVKRISADKEKMRSTLTSLEKANMELKKAQMEIIRAEKLASVGRLSAGIAHEIGNPIGIVIGYLELLKQKDITEPERNDYIQRTEVEIERINTIIHQLLEVARPSNSSPKAVSVHAIIRDMVEVLRVQPLISKIDVTLDLNAEDDTVFADPDQLRQVFLNLFINAADAVAAQGQEYSGRLNIATELDRGEESGRSNSPARIKIMFIDNGPGIPQEYLGDIFDPFFTTKEPGKGTGLGLSVSFMIVESMGGGIGVSSAVDKGTAMIVTLPIVDTTNKHNFGS